MLAGDEASPPDHVAKRIRSYLSTYHATHPDEGCVLPTLGPEIARAAPEIRAAVERSLKRVQKSWSERLGDSDAGWGLIAQCVGAIVLARVVESERTRQEILASSRRFLQDKVQVPAAGGKAAQAKAPEPAGAAAAGAAPEHAATPLADAPVAATAGAGSPGPATPASEPVGDGAVRAQAPAAPPRPAGTQATTKLAQLEPSAAAGDGAAEVAAGAAPRAPRKRTTATRSRPPT
jgi:hypothetical protein